MLLKEGLKTQLLRNNALSCTESETVKDIVLDMTGIDLNKITKEQLNREMIEECLSAKTITPEPRLVSSGSRGN